MPQDVDHSPLQTSHHFKPMHCYVRWDMPLISRRKFWNLNSKTNFLKESWWSLMLEWPCKPNPVRLEGTGQQSQICSCWTRWKYALIPAVQHLNITSNLAASILPTLRGIKEREIHLEKEKEGSVIPSQFGMVHFFWECPNEWQRPHWTTLFGRLKFLTPRIFLGLPGGLRILGGWIVISTFAPPPSVSVPSPGPLHKLLSGTGFIVCEYVAR